MSTSGNRRSEAETRPRKKLRERKRRVKVHKKRLLALGVPEETLRTATVGDLRELLRRPEELKKQVAKQKKKSA